MEDEIVLDKALSWVKVSHLVLAMLALLCGGAAWATTIHINVMTNTRSIEKMGFEVKELPDIKSELRFIARSLTRIEGILDDRVKRNGN
jgi:hypothetical protein